jgi:hypothetical protein
VICSFYKTDGMSPIQDFSALPNEKDARGSESSRFEAFVILGRTVGSFEPLYLGNPDQRDSLASVMPTHRTHLPWSAARRCAWPKRERSIVLCARLKESDFVRLKSWDHSPGHPNPSRLRSIQTGIRRLTGRIGVSHDCGTNFAFLFANIVSIPRS